MGWGGVDWGGANTRRHFFEMMVRTALQKLDESQAKADDFNSQVRPPPPPPPPTSTNLHATVAAAAEICRHSMP